MFNLAWEALKPICKSAKLNLIKGIVLVYDCYNNNARCLVLSLQSQWRRYGF